MHTRTIDYIEYMCASTPVEYMYSLPIHPKGTNKSTYGLVLSTSPDNAPRFGSA